jgi:hypothetical protein
MRAKTVTGVVAAFAVLVLATGLVFEGFDRSSHSASDTIRPFLITMGPIWTLAIVAAWALLRERR